MLPVLDFDEIWPTYFNICGQFFMLKWYLDKDRNIVKLKSKFGGFQNMQLKYGGTVSKKKNASLLSYYKQGH